MEMNNKKKLDVSLFTLISLIVHHSLRHSLISKTKNRARLCCRRDAGGCYIGAEHDVA